MERHCQRRIHLGGLQTVAPGKPELLEAEPGRAAEAALQSLFRLQALGQAPEDPHGAARIVRRTGPVRVGVRVHQVGDDAGALFGHGPVS